MKEYKSEMPEITLKYKPSGIVTTQIKGSDDSYKLLKKMYDEDTLDYCESSIVIYFNQANCSIGWQKLSQGGITSTVIDVRMILVTALNCGATGLIVSHNHPSGALKSSEQDDTLTKKLNEACKIMDLRLLDHVIVTSKGYYSYVDEGKL